MKITTAKILKENPGVTYNEISERNTKEILKELDRLYWLNLIQAAFSVAIFISICMRDVL